MIYIHSFTPIEKEIFRKLKLGDESVSQLDAKHISDMAFLERHLYLHPTEIILYSFLDYTHYDYLPSFQQELDTVKLLVKFATQNKLANIILMTYPGVYFNANNLFSQHKAVIQQQVANSGIPYSFLAINAISSFEKQIHSLHSMYYVPNIKKYAIPLSNKKVIYNIEIDNLLEIIKKVAIKPYSKTFEVFDSVYLLEEYLEIFSDNIPILPMNILKFKLLSYMHEWHSPTILELLSSPLATMHKIITEKELGINLTQHKNAKAYRWFKKNNLDKSFHSLKNFKPEHLANEVNTPV